jgi:predicted GNAT family acetyltransferase
MVRVAPVYTPPEHRGHGYASAATAAASQWALDQGADHVLLYTDIANPITNRIYPRIGYQPLEDSAEYTFG